MNIPPIKRIIFYFTDCIYIDIQIRFPNGHISTLRGFKCIVKNTDEEIEYDILRPVININGNKIPVICGHLFTIIKISIFKAINLIKEENHGCMPELGIWEISRELDKNEFYIGKGRKEYGYESYSN